MRWCLDISGLPYILFGDPWEGFWPEDVHSIRPSRPWRFSRFWKVLPGSAASLLWQDSLSPIRARRPFVESLCLFLVAHLASAFRMLRILRHAANPGAWKTMTTVAWSAQSIWKKQKPLAKQFSLYACEAFPKNYRSLLGTCLFNNENHKSCRCMLLSSLPLCLLGGSNLLWFACLHQQSCPRVLDTWLVLTPCP